MDEIMKEYAERILTFMTEEAYKPMSIKEIAEDMGFHESGDFKILVKTLVQMEQSGMVIRTRSDRYGLPEKMSLLKGRLTMNAKGYGFVVPEEAGMDDIFIPAHELNLAMHGDTVMVRVSSANSGQRREGSIVRIIERGLKETVGTYIENKGFGFVTLDDKKMGGDIFIPNESKNGAIDGHKVVVKIVAYPDGVHSAEGEIGQILGHKNDPGVDILSIIYKHGLPQDFPEDVLAQANKVKDQIQEKDLFKRRDLRSETIVTIDGADAKDLDDAVSVTELPNGNYKLGVHIADVSYYVTENSPIDREAYERGTSVYLVDRVIPMIPHRLSNGICSLNPNVDRLTLSCEMEIDSNGQAVSHEIFQSVINTTARMTYTEVNEILVEEKEETCKKYAELVPFFKLMETLAKILRKKRFDRGAIDFDFKESKVLVANDGKPLDVVIRERSVAEKLIEEFMLAANETIAEHFHWLEVPFIYRIHEDPNEEKLKRFFEFILNFGLFVRGSANDIHPRALQEIIEGVSGKPEEMVISKIMLRSMKQAKYDPESLGHFGLSTDFYTHFTSPIRRYPDLIVHRLIRTYLIDGFLDEQTQAKWEALLGDIAVQSSRMERRSVDAERETDELKKTEYMADKIGEEYLGIVSSVTNWGMFIELPNTIEGLVHVSNMFDDYYHFDERQYCMIGERTGKIYRIGDEVAVKVAQVSIEGRTIDFELVGDAGTPRRRERGPGKIFKISNSKKFEKSSTGGRGKGKSYEDRTSSGGPGKRKRIEDKPSSNPSQKKPETSRSAGRGKTEVKLDLSTVKSNEKKSRKKRDNVSNAISDIVSKKKAKPFYEEISKDAKKPKGRNKFKG